MVIGTDPAKDQEILRGDAVKLIVSRGKPKVPDVPSGVDRAEAEKQITDQRLTPQVDDGKNRHSSAVPKGKVIGVSPAPGNELPIGTTVFIILSKGPEPKPVPDLRNKTKEEAFEALQEIGYEPREGTPRFDPEVEGGRVIGTDPGEGEKLEGDSKVVTVVLSNAVTVPNLISKSAEEAESELTELGLTANFTVFGGNKVVQQSPGPNSRVAPGSTIDMLVFI
jgi:beta-lactam-binding protein with PASTA domain